MNDTFRHILSGVRAFRRLTAKRFDEVGLLEPVALVFALQMADGIELPSPAGVIVFPQHLGVMKFDEEGKDVYTARLAKACALMRAVAVAQVQEVWMASAGSDLPPSQAPGRIECLYCTLEDGRGMRTWMAPIQRSDGKVRAGRWEEMPQISKYAGRFTGMLRHIQ
jgi:hypothetical protein